MECKLKLNNLIALLVCEVFAVVYWATNFNLLHVRPLIVNKRFQEKKILKYLIPTSIWNLVSHTNVAVGMI